MWKPQRFVQVRIVKNVPEMIDDLAISPKLIRKHKLDRSQHECEKCVVAGSSGVPVRANSLVVDTLDFNIYAVTESSSGVTI